MAEIDECIATYLQAIEIEGKTAKTIASYTNSLEDFRRVGRRLGLPERVTEYKVPHVYAFLGALRERGASAGYQHRRHREVKTCFSWLKRMEFVDDNVFAKVPLVKRPYLVKPPFTPADVQALLDCQDRGHLTGCRNYALILFLLDTGLRASECIAIELADMDWERGRAFVRHGKGEKQRWVGFGERTAAALRDYIERFRNEDEGALFTTRDQHAMTTAGTLEVLLRRIGERAGVEKVHPHRFRHTFATWAIESGAPCLSGEPADRIGCAIRESWRPPTSRVTAVVIVAVQPADECLRAGAL